MRNRILFDESLQNRFTEDQYSRIITQLKNWPVDARLTHSGRNKERPLVLIDMFPSVAHNSVRHATLVALDMLPGTFYLNSGAPHRRAFNRVFVQSAPKTGLHRFSGESYELSDLLGMRVDFSLPVRPEQQVFRNYSATVYGLPRGYRFESVGQNGTNEFYRLVSTTSEQVA